MSIIFEIFVLILLLVFAVFFIMQFFNMIFRGFAPFISTRSPIINKIIDELDINDNSVVFEFGCGKAGFLRAVRKRNNKAGLIGVEYSFVPYLLGRIQNSFLGTRIKFLKKNFLKVDIHEADVIYCYLNVNSMKILEEKFEKECKPGTIIVSYQFPMHNTKSEKIIKVREGKDKIYFYKI